MKKNKLLKIFILMAGLMISSAGWGQTYLLDEDFSSITTGDNTTTVGSNTKWNGNDNFPTVVNAFQAGGAVRIGTSKASGSITSDSLDLSVNGGSFKVSFDVKGWTTIEGDIKVTVTGLTAQTVSYIAKMSDTFENKILTFTGGQANSTVKFETTAKRAFLDNIKIYYESGPTITVDPSSLTGFTYVAGGGPSLEKSFTVSGINLTADISITASANYEISTTSGSGYTSPITLIQNGGTVNDTTIYVRLKAGLNAGNYFNEDITASSTGAIDKTVTCSGTVMPPPDPEPSNHVTGFTATTGDPTYSVINVAWVDAAGTQLPSGYLIKGSSVGYGDIVAPVDGTPEADAPLVKNIPYGVQVASFTGLNENTTYYFKIYPYTNSGININYKTDGVVPQDDATTEIAPPTINFDDNSKWVAGSVSLTSYASDHKYSDKNWIFTGGPGLRNTTSAQDGFPGALGTYSWRLHTNTTVNWTATYTENLATNQNFTGFGFSARRWDNDPSPAYTVSYSTDGGNKWTTATDIGSNGVLDNSAFGNSSDWKMFFQTIDTLLTGLEANKFIVKFSATTGERIMVDNFTYEITTEAPDSTTYTGTGNWANGSNWSNGMPGENTNVTIEGFVTVDDIYTCNNFTIAPTGRVTIPETVNQQKGLWIKGDFLIRSDATGAGSFIGIYDQDLNWNYEVQGTTTVERYISGASYAWHLISSPVSNQAIAGDWIPTSTGYDFYAWNEPTQTWLNQKVSANNITHFIPCKGYLVAYEETGATKTFTGTLNDGAQTLGLTVTGATSYYGSNLAGNPYPSSIDWKGNNNAIDKSKLVGYNASEGVKHYIWNDASGNYGVYSDANAGDAGTNGANRYIAPMQGFFVSAASDGSFLINDSARVHSSQAWLKSGNNYEFRLCVNAPQGYGSDELLLEFGHNVSVGSAEKWFSFVPTAPSIYSPIEDKKFSIRYLSIQDETLTIPVSFIAGVDGTYTLTANFASSTYSAIKLEDKITGKVHDLLLTPEYSFSANKSDISERFLLHFTVTYGIENLEENADIQIYSYGNSIYLNNNTDSETLVSVYNITGRQIYQDRVGAGSQHTFTINAPTGLYIVKALTGKSITSRKVFIW
ncbi:MAG TPA: T9SS type A sorting domain-containing protein [Bacteroidales bacterium]|jgi:hypothetical protein|nr:T9SS type A sorting domain-containing protein [Bacteroidales bacterium]HPX34156.1 T9SS type A sorting domain-containing protein [Bacteroidales bacterium]